MGAELSCARLGLRQMHLTNQQTLYIYIIYIYQQSAWDLGAGAGGAMPCQRSKGPHLRGYHQCPAMAPRHWWWHGRDVFGACHDDGWLLAPQRSSRVAPPPRTAQPSTPGAPASGASGKHHKWPLRPVTSQVSPATAGGPHQVESQTSTLLRGHHGGRGGGEQGEVHAEWGHVATSYLLSSNALPCATTPSTTTAVDKGCTRDSVSRAGHTQPPSPVWVLHSGWAA